MNQALPPLSVVVPALNEADNLPSLVRRVAEPLVSEGITYEIVIIDDHSTDRSAAIIKDLSATYNVRLVAKRGKRGKAYSLLEGFEVVHYDLVCMIDADLQYPPEAIIPMYRKLLANQADVVVTNRVEHQTSPLRKLSTKVFHFLMARMLFGIDYDTQSGLKLFHKQVLNGMDLKPSAWTFDLEFLIRSLENNRKIVSFAIPFGERLNGEAKINPFTAAYTMTKHSIKLRFNSSISKIRRGYQTNLELARRPAVMSVLFVAGLLSSLVMLNASAPQAQAASIFDPIRNMFSSSDEPQPVQQPAAQPQPTQPQANQSGSGSPASPTPAAAPAATPAQTPAAQPAQNRTVAQTAPNNGQRTQTDTAVTNAGRPATDGKDTDYYANQSLSADRTSQLLCGAKWAALTGAIIVGTALLAWAIWAIRHSYKRKVSRSLYRV